MCDAVGNLPDKLLGVGLRSEIRTLEVSDSSVDHADLQEQALGLRSMIIRFAIDFPLPIHNPNAGMSQIFCEATDNPFWASFRTMEMLALADTRLAATSDSSSTVRTLPDDKFSKNAGFFMRVNRPISKCSAKF